jgi:predicted nucleotidyltransferase
MTPLLPEQIEALQELRDACTALTIDVVVIGAIALRIWIPDLRRLTEDVDVAVGLDLDEFEPLTTRLTAAGWRQDHRWEPRWHSREQARVDLLPLGRRARQEKQIRWPRAETVMRAVGYDNAFSEATFREIAAGLEMRVVPLHVLALLKIVAYLDAPAIRQKDIGDLLLILDRYAEDGERRFGDDVLDAAIQYDEAGAFLLGRDLRTSCRGRSESEESAAVRQLLQRTTDPDFQIPPRLLHQHATAEYDTDDLSERQLKAMALGFAAHAE